MHNAPPVAYPVGRFVWGRVLAAAIASLSALGLIGWQGLAQVSGLQAWLAWGFWSVCVLGAILRSPGQTLADGHLLWSGESWFWRADGDPASHAQALSVAVGLDAGDRVLLWVHRLDAQGRTCGPLTCAWVQAQAMPSKWHGFRCAVYSRPKTHAFTRGTTQDHL